MWRSTIRVSVFCLFLAISGGGVSEAQVEPAASQEDKKPNVLFLLSDDQRPDTIHRLGNPLIHTPNLDRLVDSGISFTRAFTYYPLCVPSRAAILSGSMGFQNGVLPDYSRDFAPDVQLWPEVMSRAGYQTWYVGKWHSPGRPTRRGYDDTRGLYSSGGGRVEVPTSYDYRGEEVTGYRGWVFQNDRGEVFPEKGVGLTAEISADFADAAIDVIQQPHESPYFLHVNFTAPHDPLLIPPRHLERYQAEEMPLPPNFRSVHPFDHGNFWGRDERLLPWPRTPYDVRRDLAVYYAVISHLDEQVGRILQALEQSGQLENTIIIYGSDHGLAMGSHGLRGKQNMYEHTIRVPMVFAGPGILENHSTEQMVYLRELYPTVCDFLGIEIPGQVEGESFASILRGDRSYPGHDAIFAMFRDSQRMIRTGEWKLIEYPRAGQIQLFHLSSDPWELNNLADDPKHRSRLQNLSARLHRWQEEQGDQALMNE